MTWPDGNTYRLLFTAATISLEYKLQLTIHVLRLV
jgi:hypothetical protein